VNLLRIFIWINTAQQAQRIGTGEEKPVGLFLSSGQPRNPAAPLLCEVNHCRFNEDDSQQQGPNCEFLEGELSLFGRRKTNDNPSCAETDLVADLQFFGRNNFAVDGQQSLAKRRNNKPPAAYALSIRPIDGGVLVPNAWRYKLKIGLLGTANDARQPTDNM